MVLISHWLYQHRAATDDFQQVASGCDSLGHAILRGVTLGRDREETVLFAHFEPSNATVAVGVEGIGQPQDRREI